MKLMPQEVEVRYIIPSLRKEFTIELQKKGLKQNQIAKLLNITPAAVSQYLNKKRGTIEFNEEIQKQVTSSVNTIIKDSNKLQQEIYKLTELIKTSGFICEIHKKYDRIPKQCELCFYHGNH